MNVINFRRGGFFLVASLVGCAGTVGSSALPGSPFPENVGPGAEQPSLAELEALYRERTEQARNFYTAADADFMTQMISHHAQALEMARLAPLNGASESIKTLSARIINSQIDEIAIMRRWLEDRGEPVPEVSSEGMPTGHEAHVDHSMHMPGMLTPEQMVALRAARGTGFDRLLLTFMIQHHNGAVAMVTRLFATDGAGQDEEVFKFASDAQADQGSEVARMESMLELLP